MLKHLTFRRQQWTLLTGGTGFLGQHILLRLLSAGRPCVVGLRGDIDAGWSRLNRLLEGHGLDAKQLHRRGQLEAVSLDLGRQEIGPVRQRIGTVVHAAASTRFSAGADGEPLRTNVQGTEAILDWCIAKRVKSLHLVSTAYVCGRTDGRIAEASLAAAPESHNDYEFSKYQAELLAGAWATQFGGTLTIHRPSVIVGASDSGAASKFDGFYLPVRATELLSRQYAGAGESVRHNIPLRIEGSPTGTQNIVPVDWVAEMVAGIVTRPELHGRVYHLVHPDPPTNEQIKRALEAHFSIGGGVFVAPEGYAQLDLNETERAFRDVSRPVRHYMTESFAYARTNTQHAEAVLHRPCPAYDQAALLRLIRFAVGSRFGRSAQPGAVSAACAAYFEQFLPARIGHSSVARAAAMDIAVRFIIGDLPANDWLCTFRQGHLVEVRRQCRSIREDVGYRATEGAFWRGISGKVHPEELFLSGEAEVFGDVERALKLAMILNAFSREFPCTRDTLAAEATTQPVRRSA